MNDPGFRIIPITPEDLLPVLEVYRQCEDFLALGSDARALLEIVQRDIAGSEQQGGCTAGFMIYPAD
jgi:hypothetical protein